MKRYLQILALVMLGLAATVKAEEAFVVSAIGDYWDFDRIQHRDVNIRMTVVYDSSQWLSISSYGSVEQATWDNSVISITVEVTDDKGPVLGSFALSLDDGAEEHKSETTLVTYKDFDAENAQWELKSTSYSPDYHALDASVSLSDYDGGTILDVTQYPDPLDWQGTFGQIHAVENIGGSSWRNVSGIMTSITPLLYRSRGDCISTAATGTAPGPEKGAAVSQAAKSCSAD